MNEATISRRLPILGSAAPPVLIRALWKEWRMLRGFWLGIAVLATLQMLAVAPFWSPGSEGQECWPFASAWGAGALYAVGAAITLFAVEREERTDVFLRLLPRHDRALLAGKILAALLTSYALVALLIPVGALVAGGRFPDGQDARGLAGIGALTILEWLLWGILASLLCPQPLIAAVLAIAAATIGTHLAFAASSSNAMTVWSSSHAVAVPQRLLLLAAVAALEVWLGLRWLRPHRQDSTHNRADATAADAQAFGAAKSITAAAALAPIRPIVLSKRRMFVRLLWQTWREGWKPMLAVIPVGLFLMFAQASLSIYARDIPVGVLGLLAIPALYGALVFRADQRARQYQFLTVHAARPAIVWAARHAAWLTPPFLIALVVQAGAIAVTVYGIRSGFERHLEYYWGQPGLFDNDLNAPYTTALAIEQGWSLFTRSSALTWSAVLTAYGLGQLCSMLIRSSVLAGFAALVLSAVVTLGSIAASLWDLPGAWFVAPLGIAALLATFIHCRSWLAESRRVKPWLVTCGLMAASLVAIVLSVPPVRMAQLESGDLKYEFTREPLGAILERWRREEPAARALATRYERLSAELNADLNARDAQRVRELEFHGRATSDGGPGGLGADGRFGQSDVHPDDILALLKDNQSRFDELAELINPAGIGLGRMPNCRMTPPPPGAHYPSPIDNLIGWLFNDVERLLATGDLDTALTRLITARGLAIHGLQYQPSSAWERVNHEAHETWLLKWATAPDQTSERLLRAAEELRQCELMVPSAADSVVADFLDMRDVLLGQVPPSFFQASKGQPAPSWNERLAYFAHDLPGERARALAALELFIAARIDYVDAASSGLTLPKQPGRADVAAIDVRRLLDPAIEWSQSGSRTPSPALLAKFTSWEQVKRQQRALDASETSYLTAVELAQRGESLLTRLTTYLAHQARRRGEMLRLALIAYQLDNGQYPETLAELVPKDGLSKYLPVGVPLDPFTQGMFQYRPHGFDLSLLEGMEMVTALPAGTPLLWSVGLAYAQPHEDWVAESHEGGRTTLVQAEDPARVTSADPPSEAKPIRVMRFYNTIAYGGRPPIFPLPKLP